MKPVFSIFLFFISTLAFSQTSLTSTQATAAYLDSIRHNRAALTVFFQQMPKGGDLHHHFSGSVYTETYVNYVIEKNYWIHTQTLEVKDTSLPASKNPNWKRFSDLQKTDQLLFYRQKLLEQWSVKDYVHDEIASDAHFFGTFDQFNIASKNLLEPGLLELKKRAQSENVQYIETMRGGPSCNLNPTAWNRYNSTLHQLQSSRNEIALKDTLQRLFQQLLAQGAEQCAATYAKDIETIHQKLNIDDSTFLMRYQTHVVRVLEPVEVFTRLVLSFLAAERSPLLVGVNIVAPEDNPVSMRDYWLHMQFFQFCHQQFPQVKYAMHAGELTLGLVPSEELTWHINAAVRTAGAQRIGHGVDLPYESEPFALLEYMRNNNIAVEINLTSNEFILRVKDDRHPILLYQNAGVPIVISTDDAGVLRSNLTEQFVLLAHRYPSISYTDIKKFVYNSIEYSFIEEPAIKTQLQNTLNQQFTTFEQLISTTATKKF